MGAEPRPRGNAVVELVSVTDNGDGTATLNKRRADGTVETAVVSVERARELREEHPKTELLGRAIGKGMQDCTWCRYGKPSLTGAIVGAGVAYATGMEPTRGVVWGGIGGLFYGHMRG